MRKRNNYTLIDLFAGAGGFSCAARACGLQILAAVENDTHASETYRRNFVINKKHQPLLFSKDINSLSPKELMREIEKKFKLAHVDIVVGGPPCQGFSKHRYKDSGVDDPRNELLIRYFEYIRTISPKFFLVENVCGLLSSRHSKYLDKFFALAQNNKYVVSDPVVLNAKDYGVPQNRKRVFILGHRKGITLSASFQWPPKPSHFAPTSLQVKAGKKPKWETAESVFAKPLGHSDPNTICMKHSEYLIKVFASTPLNGGSRFESNRKLPCHRTHNGHNDVYGRICVDKPGPTMTTGCTNPSKGRFLHPYENHGISVRHAARFQTFPENFIFSGGIIAASRQIGNAVPVRLGVVILRAIKQELAREELNHES